VFPVIYWQSKDAKPGPMTIPWEVAEYAYSVYSSKYGRSQSLERLRERGGFHASELDDFVPDWRERASRITQLERELAQAQSDLVEVDAANVRLARDLQSARSATAPSVQAIKAAQQWEAGVNINEIDINAMVAAILGPVDSSAKT